MPPTHTYADHPYPRRPSVSIGPSQVFDVGTYRLFAEGVAGRGTNAARTTSCTSIAFMRGGRALLSGSESGRILLADLGRPQDPTPCIDCRTIETSYDKAHDFIVSSIAPHPEGRKFVSAGFDGSIKLWKPLGEAAEARSLRTAEARDHSWWSRRRRKQGRSTLLDAAPIERIIPLRRYTMRSSTSTDPRREVNSSREEEPSTRGV